MSPGPALLLIGHGSRSAAGVDEYWRFADVLRGEANGLEIGCGFIELAEPDLDTAIDGLVRRGATSIGAVPLVLLGAGHMKNDGPAALERGRRRHPGVQFNYGRSLGIHPLVLALAEDRIRAAVGGDHPGELAVVLVGRGSSDPDANADLYKVGRLLQDSRGLGLVEPAFISLAPPSVPEALERCRLLGATTVAVVPYFLFTGILVDRIHAQADAWGSEHREVAVRHGAHLGPDARLAQLVLERHREAIAGEARMNCDCCVYRIAIPGYEEQVGRPAPLHAHPHSHGHGHPHNGGVQVHETTGGGEMHG
jgi:sirohydrochlorin ferrochelatase